MREQITLYEDQYQFYKELKSKRLLVAFVEFMFEDIEPEWLNWIEKVAFNSLKIRMQNQKKKSDAWKKSRGGWRPGKTSSELSSKNNTTNNTKTTEQTTNKQEDISIGNILSYDNIYSNYYWKNKWVDEKLCDKLINKLLDKWITLDDINKSMVLYNCECRIKQDFTFVKKLDTRLKQFQLLDDSQLDEWLFTIIKQFRDKKKSDDKFANSKPCKQIRDDLKQTFWDVKIKELRKQANTVQLNFT